MILKWLRILTWINHNHDPINWIIQDNYVAIQTFIKLGTRFPYFQMRKKSPRLPEIGNVTLMAPFLVRIIKILPGAMPWVHPCMLHHHTTLSNPMLMLKKCQECRQRWRNNSTLQEALFTQVVEDSLVLWWYPGYWQLLHTLLESSV